MILAETDVNAELNTVTPVDIIDAGQATFDYLRLDNTDFERLLYALAKCSAPHGLARTWDSATVMVRGADAGRDVLLTCIRAAAGVIQCKRLESSMPLPAVFREIAKLILFANVQKDLSFSERLTYILAVARDPAKTVVEYFARRAELESANEDAIRAAAREVRDSYETLKNFSNDEAERTVLDALPFLDLHLVRPVDLDEWLCREAGVSHRFFRQRVVVDNEPMRQGFADVMNVLKHMSGQLSNIEPITDEDLSILRDDISDMPETHRMNVGIGMLFGFPREMFVGRTALEDRIGRLQRILIEIDQDYTDWTFKQVNRLAGQILESAEAQFVSPFAKQVPEPFLGHVAKECLVEAISGSVMDDIVRKVRGEKKFDSDDERLRDVRDELHENGLSYLAGDFSKLEGDTELVAWKRAIIAQLMHNIEAPDHLTRALDQGIAFLKPKLLEAADELRRLCKHKTTIVLTGTRGIDKDASLKRLADTVRGLER